MAHFSKMPRLSVEEYLDREQRATVRHEYIDGQLFAMTGASEAHNIICGNVFAALHGHLRGSGCRAFMNDMKVKVEAANSFYYPDIMVTCEPYDGESVFKQAPVVLMEVLSPSTRHIDRREKMMAYRQLESLRQYLLVHQNRYRVDSYRKCKDVDWEISTLGRGDSIVFDSFSAALELSLDAVYEGVVIDSFVEESDDDLENYQGN